MRPLDYITLVPKSTKGRATEENIVPETGLGSLEGLHLDDRISMAPRDHGSPTVDIGDTVLGCYSLFLNIKIIFSIICKVLPSKATASLCPPRRRWGDGTCLVRKLTEYRLEGRKGPFKFPHTSKIW